MAVRCPMEGREGAELVLAYCARRLEPEKSAWYERHLEACDSCREMLAAQKQVWEALDYWNRLPVPQDFDRRLEWRIEAEKRKPWLERLVGGGLSGSRMSGWLRPALPVVSVGALALAMFLVRTPGTSMGDGQSRIESAEVEQAERALEDLEMIRQFTLPPRDATTRNPM